MPVSPDGGARFAKALSDLYADAAATLINTVARRMAAGITDRGWAEAKLSEVLLLRRDAQRLVARLQDQADATLYELLVDAYQAGVVAVGGPRADLADPGVVATNRAAVQAYAEQLAGSTRATHTRILRTTEDVYRTAVADVAGQTVTGTATRRETAARALTRLAAAGVTGFTDRAGRNWALESYVEMATRTAAGQAHVQGGLDRYVQTGRDLVIVSDAPEECRLCRPYEGRVLSLSGRTPEPEPPNFAGSLAAARSDGFMHPNCRHSVSAYTPGLTRTRDTARLADPDGDRARQTQRRLERDVREAKRRVAASRPFGATPEHERNERLLRARQGRLRQFVADEGRKRLPAREALGAR